MDDDDDTIALSPTFTEIFFGHTNLRNASKHEVKFVDFRIAGGKQIKVKF